MRQTFAAAAAALALAGCQCGGERTATSRPTIDASPATLDFGKVALGTSSEQPVTLTNSGASPVSLQSVSVTDDVNSVFTLVGAVPATIAGGGSAEVRVRFTASATARVESARLRIASDAANAPELIVALLGESADPGAIGCTSETEAELCARLKLDCDSVTAADNCGTQRTVSCGSCAAPRTCGGGGTPNVCGCKAESDPGLCARLKLDCDSVTAADNCGTQRTVSCGSCAGPKTCGGGGAANVCGCKAETDAELCAAAGATCGDVTRTDACGAARTVSCGSCGPGLTCGASKPNVCGLPPCTFRSQFQDTFGQAWSPADAAFLLSDGTVRHGMSQLDLNASRNAVPSTVKCTGSTATVTEVRLYKTGSSTQILWQKGGAYIYGLGDAMWHQVNGYAPGDLVENTLVRLYVMEEPTYVQWVSALRVATKSAEAQVPAGDLADFQAAADKFVIAVEAGSLTFAMGTGHGLDFWQTRQTVNGKTFSFQYSTAYGWDPYIGFQREGTGAWGPNWGAGAPVFPKCAGCIRGDFSGKTYQYCEAKKSWDDAKAYCRAEGGHLASIPDVFASAFLRAFSPGAGDTFMGFNDVATEGTWVWESGAAAGYTRWYSGEPNDWGGGEDCGTLIDMSTRTTFWNDDSCSKTKSFFCEL